MESYEVELHFSGKGVYQELDCLRAKNRRKSNAATVIKEKMRIASNPRQRDGRTNEG
jgi:hypothetical protein